MDKHLYLFPIDREDFQRGRCNVAAAVLGAGALGAGASIWGSSNAAGAQTQASQAALAQQKQMFEIAQKALAPYIQAGQGGIGALKGFIDPSSSSSPLNALMKLLMPGAGQTEALEQTPGFQFTRDMGLKSVNNALAARGLAGSGGAVARGAADYTTGLANNTWKDVVDRLLATLGGGSNALQSFVNTGANSAGNLAGGAIQSGNSQAGTLIGMGNAQAGAATSIGNAIGQGGNSLASAALINQLTSKNNAPTSNSGMYGENVSGGMNTDTGTYWG